jgi:hypothetical protein
MDQFLARFKMKRIFAFFLCFLLLIPMTTFSVEAGQAMYVGGTVAALKEGVSGKLDTSSQALLSFDYSGSKLAIPFERIDSYECSQRVARHLGVLPAIAVGLVKRRQRKHFFRISWRDESNSLQVAIFEVSKDMPYSLLAILQARAPQGCKPWTAARCDVQAN